MYCSCLLYTSIIYGGSLVNPALLGLAKPGCAIYNSAEMTLEQVLDLSLIHIWTQWCACSRTMFPAC